MGFRAFVATTVNSISSNIIFFFSSRSLLNAQFQFESGKDERREEKKTRSGISRFLLAQIFHYAIHYDGFGVHVHCYNNNVIFLYFCTYMCSSSSLLNFIYFISLFRFSFFIFRLFEIYYMQMYFIFIAISIATVLLCAHSWKEK